MRAHGKITTTMTSREFNQHTGAAKSAADQGPVIVTDRGIPSYVLTTYADYVAANTEPRSVRVSALAALEDPNYRPGDSDIMDFIPKREIDLPRRYSVDEDE